MRRVISVAIAHIVGSYIAMGVLFGMVAWSGSGFPGRELTLSTILAPFAFPLIVVLNIVTGFRHDVTPGLLMQLGLLYTIWFVVAIVLLRNLRRHRQRGRTSQKTGISS